MEQKIKQAELASVFFLLTDASSGDNSNTTTVSVRICPPGGQFSVAQGTSSAVADETGKPSGWWKHTLLPIETAAAGRLILEARGPGCFAWRDTILIDADPHGVTAGDVAISRSEAAQAGIDVTIADAPDPPVTQDLIANSAFRPALAPWRTYCPAGLRADLIPELPNGVELQTTGAKKNCQLYQVIGDLSAGEYRLDYAIKSTRDTQIGIRLIEHEPPYRSLGLSSEIDLLAGQLEETCVNITVPEGRKNLARVMFWLAGVPAEAVIYLYSVRLRTR